jgi:hypothetical protein
LDDRLFWELQLFGDEIEPVARRRFLKKEGAIEFMRRAFSCHNGVYSACLSHQIFRAWSLWYFNGKEVVEISGPWVLTRAEASRLYVEGGKVRGLPAKYES